jgi:hypothetical protein
LMDALGGALDEALAIAEQRGLLGPARNDRAVA